MHKEPRKSSARRAFSLVEIVLAIGILTFAIFALVAMLPIGLKIERESADESAATNLMAAIRADLRNSTTNGVSPYFGIQPTPWAATNLVTTNLLFTDDQSVYTNSVGAPPPRFHTILTFHPASTNATTQIVTPPGVLIQVAWPAAAPVSSPQGWVESYVMFPRTDRTTP